MKTLKNQNGIALIVAVGLLLMVSLIGLAAVLTSETETDIAVNKKNDVKAFYTAEGGLAAAQGDLKTAINGIGGYIIDRDTAISFLGDPMRLLTKYITNFNNRFPQDSFKAAAYMGGRESYRLKYSIVPFDTAVTSRGYTFTYKYTITSQGKYADPALGFNQKNNTIAGSFSINLDRPSFAQYALFRNLTTSTSGSQLYFAGGEKFNGPVHTNGKPGFSGSPIFNGPFTSSWGSYATSSRINNANPIFNGGSQWGVPTVTLPTNNYSQQRAAFGGDFNNTTAPNNNEIRAGLGLGGGAAVPTGVYIANNGTSNVTGGIYVQGTLDSLKLTRGSNGEQIYRFAQGGSSYTLTVDYANRQTTLNGTTYSGVPNGALFVAGAVNWLGGTSRTAATVAAQTQLTLATTGDILIKNDLIYEGAIFKDSGGVILTDPTLAEAIPDIDPNATVTLGLFSSGGNVKLGTGAPDNINVHATIMASGTNKGFGAQDLSVAAHGTVKLLGGIIEYQSQTIGVLGTGGVLKYGYSRRYWYDNRYATGFAPPFFPTRPSYLSDLASFNVSRWAAE